MIEPRDEVKPLSAYDVPQMRAEVELDSNESPWNLTPGIRAEIEEALKSLEYNRYPDISATPLRDSIAAVYELGPENILVGNGSNEVIMDILLTFGGPGRLALIFEPTYSMHAGILNITGTNYLDCPLDEDFMIDADEAVAYIGREKPDLVFVCSPNNPTGNSQKPEVIDRILEAAECPVVVDEAYGEFLMESVMGLLPKFENLIIVRTFSKAFQLAALRVGYMIANNGIVNLVNRVRLPYNMNAFSQTAAEIVIKNRNDLEGQLQSIRRERERLFEGLKQIDGVEPFPSDANFILFKTRKEASHVYNDLLNKGVLIRDFSQNKGLERCLRVTVGTAEQNGVFLKRLKEAMS
jgi:histidinol-phosphate aminotransferase